jgi:hypothetical protein
MRSAFAVAVHEEEVTLALRDLNLEREDLVDSVRYGEWARSACHPYDPPSFPGMSRWAFTMRRLRGILVPRGWRPVNDHGVPFALSPDGKTAITTARGNELTAHPTRAPRTLFAKGAVAIALARQNRVQFSLQAPGFEPHGPAMMTVIPDDASTYYLLVNRREGRLHAELSVPIEIDKSGFAVSWKPRILLGSFTIGEPSIDVDVQDDDPIEIDVTPRDRA